MGATTDHKFATSPLGKATNQGIVLQDIDCLNDFEDPICAIRHIKFVKMVDDPVNVLLSLRCQFDPRYGQRSGARDSGGVVAVPKARCSR